jgi:NMD protein affecting ribosome stability and mRNA decay
MVKPAVETCCKCGREISLREVSSYKVLPNYRLLCKDCAKEDGLIEPVKQRMSFSGTVKKSP